MAATRILIVDDSPVFVEALRVVLEESSGIQVVGVAYTGEGAILETLRLRPDLITMDVKMPGMGGLAAVEAIMAQRPTPILVLTAEPSAGDTGNFEALSRGALDLLIKPALMDAREADLRRLREHIQLLASVPVIHHGRGGRTDAPGRAPASSFGARRGKGVLGVVASTGGPSVVAELLGGLPADFPLGVALVQHLAPGFAPSLVAWLQQACALKVRLAEAGESPAAGTVLVARDHSHLLFDDQGHAVLDTRPSEQGHRPSGDLLLKSLARTWGMRAMGVVLTGMGRDGAEGLLAIHRCGGVTFAQDALSSTVDGMPAAARALRAAQHVLGRDELAQGILAAATRVAGRGPGPSGNPRP